MEKIMWMVWCVLLMIHAICDIKWRRIPLVITALGTVTGVLFCVVWKRELIDILWAILPGLGCLMYSKISKEALGYGDSLLLCGLGLVFDVEHMLLICMLSFGFAGFSALAMIVFFHKKKNYEMPFVPFLMIAVFVDIVLQMGGCCG